MKKISISLFIIGVLVIGLGVVLSFLSVNDKDKEKGNDKDNDKDNVKVITLQEIDDHFKQSQIFNQYSNYFVITTKIEENKYIIDYQGKTRAYVSSNGSVTFDLNNNVLSSTLSSDSMLYMNKNFVDEILRTVCILRGIDAGVVDRSLSLLTYEEATLEKNGYVYKRDQMNFVFKVRLDSDIILPDLNKSYISLEDFEANSVIIGDDKSIGEYKKGNILFFYNNPLKSYYIYEYGKNGDNTYKTIINMVEFFCGKEAADNLKKEMPTLVDGTFGKIIVDVDYQTKDNEIIYSSIDDSVFKEDYSLTKVIIK